MEQPVKIFVGRKHMPGWRESRDQLAKFDSSGLVQVPFDDAPNIVLTAYRIMLFRVRGKHVLLRHAFCMTNTHKGQHCHPFLLAKASGSILCLFNFKCR